MPIRQEGTSHPRARRSSPRPRAGNHVPGSRKHTERPVHGRDIIAKLIPIFANNSMRLIGGEERALRSVITEVNGEVAFVVWIHDMLDSVIVCSLEGERITELRLIRNPEKLGYIQQQIALHNEQQAKEQLS